MTDPGRGAYALGTIAAGSAAKHLGSPEMTEQTFGASSETPTPPGGVILRDPRSGEPTGALRDLALDLVLDVMPRPNLFESLIGLHRTLREMNRHGYTSLLDARVSEPEMAWAYWLLEALGLLDMRVSLALLFDPHPVSYTHLTLPTILLV